MKIGVSVPLTAASGDPGAIAHEAENLGFEWIWSVEHSCVPSRYTTRYPRSADGKVPAMYAEVAEVMGVRFEQRWKHLRESVEALRILWAQEEARYEGDIIKFPAIRVGPKPVQKPCPPIMLGAHDPKYALRRVARYADGWMPGGLSPDKAMEFIPQIKRMAREYGRDPEQLQFSVALATRGDEPT